METKEYTVLVEYKEENVDHKVGDVVSLTDEAAKPLLDDKTVELKKEEGDKKEGE